MSSHTQSRYGAVGARRAHNPEDLGSKPSTGIVKLDVKRSISPAWRRGSAQDS